MSHNLRFQVLTLPNAPVGELLRRYRNLEELGFDLAGGADHFVDWSNPSSPWFEQWTLMAAVARETSQIRLSTFVTQIPLRNPAILAHQAVTVDHISDGRLELGIGTGIENDPSHKMIGLENWSTKEKVRRYKEYVEIVDQLLSNEVTTYKGQYYQVNEAVMNPRPIQQPRPPIVIAGLGPTMLKYAVQFADVWNSLSFAADFDEQIEETRDRIGVIDSQCAVIGRDPSTLRRSYLMFDAGSRAGGGMIDYYESEEVFADKVQRIIDLGISEIGLYYPTRDEQLPKFESIARNVIPNLRAKHADSL